MNDQAKEYQQLIAKCWADDAFKTQLMADPVATLRQEGIDIQTGLDVSVHENTESQMYLMIPSRPDELSDEKLETAPAGGVACTGFGGVGPPCKRLTWRRGNKPTTVER